MGFLITDNSVRIMNSDTINIVKDIPIGIYKTVFDRMSGTYLERTEVKLAHGKIYGNSEKIAQHIIDAFGMNSSEKNLGVLLSGDKGLGKTLTCRLIIEKVFKERPIIMVSNYSPDLSDFLSNIKGCVILMDEFEKFMSGNANGSDNEDDQSKQEAILSILDGNTGCSGNLFLFTVNNLYRVDDNLKARPGRIKYHYRFKSETADVVREYCKDNLNNKENIENVVKALGSAGFVSMDIISAFVEELNNFPDETPEEALEIFNLDKCSDPDFISFVKILWDNKIELVYRQTGSIDDFFEGQWYFLDVKNYAKKRKLEEEGVPDTILISIDESIEINPYRQTEIDACDIKVDEDQNENYDKIKVLGGVLKDESTEKFMKKYNPAF